jgi:cytochrome c556
VTAHGWTIAEAVAEFERAGMPVDPARFRIAVTRMARLKRVGETRQPPGSKGGRGQARYEIWQLQLLHKDVAKWIPAPAEAGHEG